ncbi:hypothetical protein BDN70DRAFT_882750 [Pholiota conissans]|uniref:Secreted protein n=1 Tax=Pholiota conissans TaxID=109636 RepID=A0A9P5YW34_9AGAR|nr:hypothetical protein BDN70DRAFT_882750 [Pholiota conissans]
MPSVVLLTAIRAIQSLADAPPVAESDNFPITRLGSTIWFLRIQQRKRQIELLADATGFASNVRPVKKSIYCF